MMNATYRLAVGLAVLAAVLCVGPLGQAVAEDKPLKALMLTGGCCHDYKSQKVILSEGISERLPVTWTIFHDQNSSNMRDYLSKAGWSDGYDVVVYNICFAKESDVPFIDSVAAVHAAGKPAVALHCTMHSYHWNVPQPEQGEKTWPAFLGVSSKGHGPRIPCKVTKVAEHSSHPIVKHLPEGGWNTPQGELYNVQKVLPSATVLAYGENGKAKQAQACVWTNQYEKGRVFGTTLGHHNETMQAPEYLDMVTAGLRWAVELDGTE